MKIQFIEIQLTEILENEKPHLPRFFRMELHSENIPSFDHGRKLRSIFGCCCGGGNHWRLKRVRVVDKRFRRNVTQQSRAFPHHQRVPSDMRRLDRRRELPASALKNSRARALGSLVAALEQPLHSQAYSDRKSTRLNSSHLGIS